MPRVELVGDREWWWLGQSPQVRTREKFDCFKQVHCFSFVFLRGWFGCVQVNEKASHPHSAPRLEWPDNKLRMAV